MSPRQLVLVPGACLGGWAWRDVADQLHALGHDVYPVTLTGLGDRVHLADESVDLDTHIAGVLGKGSQPPARFLCAKHGRGDVSQIPAGDR
ncbi:MAG TPA: hypothetical protein VHV75_11310 [Solirubrobacteraceae bacterium]|jgi:hypothetical protein|nr:hypothetical protein [Solirubrobacteraceae bacterium]